MSPKRTPAPTAHGPPSPTPLDDHPEPSPSIGEPTLVEYNDLVIAHRKTLRHITEGLCLYCGESGHLRVDCPKKPKPESVATISRYQAPSVAFEQQPPSLLENSKFQVTMR